MADTPASPPLPKRCPVCKGAAIERMPSPTHGTFIWFRCQFCGHTWKFLVPDPERS